MKSLPIENRRDVEANRYERRLRKNLRENDVTPLFPDRRYKKDRRIETGGSNDN
jgi:hypothetical protein